MTDEGRRHQKSHDGTRSQEMWLSSRIDSLRISFDDSLGEPLKQYAFQNEIILHEKN